jgi:ABC-type multidrug transport system fused ATPase/permease subunit
MMMMMTAMVVGAMAVTVMMIVAVTMMMIVAVTIMMIVAVTIMMIVAVTVMMIMAVTMMVVAVVATVALMMMIMIDMIMRILFAAAASKVPLFVFFALPARPGVAHVRVQVRDADPAEARLVGVAVVAVGVEARGEQVLQSGIAVAAEAQLSNVPPVAERPGEARGVEHDQVGPVLPDHRQAQGRPAGAAAAPSPRRARRRHGSHRRRTRRGRHRRLAGIIAIAAVAARMAAPSTSTSSSFLLRSCTAPRLSEPGMRDELRFVHAPVGV